MKREWNSSAESQQQPKPVPDVSAFAKSFGEPPLRSLELRKDYKQHIRELLDLEKLIRQYPELMRVNIEHNLLWEGRELPLYSLTLGSRAADAPTVLLTGGMHGVERIGSQVIIAWLQTLLERLSWDSSVQQQLAQIQLVIMPILNPVGMYLNRRCNGRGIDLNRNAPIDAEDKTPWLGGGHRFGTFLPWYRGEKNSPMEAENLALERVIKRQVLGRSVAVVLDLHSGFGMQDRLWFPYAYRRKPIGNIAQYFALKTLWERTYPNHTYIFEPQSVHYLSHGDVWDYFYQLSKQQSGCHFLPLTLEMGSWNWIKKRPRQLLNFAGLFNPQMKHRHSRVLRSHLVLLDFMLAATLNSKHWLPDEKQSAQFTEAAIQRWFI